MVRQPREVAMEICREFDVKAYSIVGGQRVAKMLKAAIERDRADREQPRRTLQFTAQDWALDLDEESGEEAWWITLQLLDPEQRANTIVDHLAELSLSDVEAHALVDGLLAIIAEGRNRFS